MSYLLLLALGMSVSFNAYADAVGENDIEGTSARAQNSAGKTVLLTGAMGFIGSNFLKYMYEKYPSYRFLVLDSLTYAGNQENVPQEIRNSPRFEFWYGSVTNPILVNQLMSRSHLVVHFAAESHVSRSIFDDSVFFHTDVIGTQIMMNALVRHSSVERFIHISTSEVYGTAASESEPMSEEHLLNPRSPYAGAKAGADRLVYSYWCTYPQRVPAVIIRPSNNYGPNQHLEKVVPRFTTSALKGEEITVHGDGSAERDWLYVRDTCRALDKVLHVPNFDKIKHQVINVGTGQPVSVLRIAQLVCKALGASPDLVKFIGDRPGQVARHISPTDKARELLGWEAEVDFERGLLETIEWYKNNEAWWRRLEWMQHTPILTENNKIEKH